MQFLSSGKVKDIYDMNDGHLVFRFSDRVSAYDVEFVQDIPRKGEVLCKFAEYWFSKISCLNHFVERQSATEIMVKQMDMIPLECVVRGYVYGSYMSRIKSGQIVLPKGASNVMASKLPTLIFDPSTKAKHDAPITKEMAISSGLVTKVEYDELEAKTLKVYEEMSEIVGKAGFILADLKLEFGKIDGEIILGDSIGPDECRLWPIKSYCKGKVQESYDKQILRDWLAQNGYKEKFTKERAAGKNPIPPSIPDEIISKMSEKYVAVYEMITGESMGSTLPSYE
ncbi:MAG: phosphoribosylaminoimidazolesuccinocarboxamide synthase [Cenarchaeum symbiont of Oopsacas minuta]|nr:phosphoribosylaminoimidazolesuccinocarboxamide synthase [Cenarchaeum symbiont of Oopsacas minuta]